MIVPVYFKGEAHPISLTLVGAGGTGSVLLQHLARIHKSLVAKGKQGIMVTCVDPDVVSAANMGRQLFTENDIGRRKSIVLVERINRFYGTSWEALPFKFDHKITEQQPFPGNIIVSCVDNTKTRRFINEYLFNVKNKRYHESIANHFWLDTGNSKETGQVLLGSHSSGMKTVVEYFPDMEKHESKDDTPSCSLAEALDHQDLMINPFVAQVAAQILWDLLTKPVIDWAGAYININKKTPIIKIKA